MFSFQNDKEIKNRVLAAVGENLNFREEQLLGIPGSYLDEVVFPPSDLIKDKPFLTHLKGGFSEHKMTSPDFEEEFNKYLKELKSAN